MEYRNITTIISFSHAMWPRLNIRHFTWQNHSILSYQKNIALNLSFSVNHAVNSMRIVFTPNLKYEKRICSITAKFLKTVKTPRVKQLFTSNKWLSQPKVADFRACGIGCISSTGEWFFELSTSVLELVKRLMQHFKFFVGRIQHSLH